MTRRPAHAGTAPATRDASGRDPGTAGADAPPDLRLAGPAIAAWLTTVGCLGLPAYVSLAIAALAVACAAIACAGRAWVPRPGRRAPALVRLTRRPWSAGVACLLLGVGAAATCTGVRMAAREISPVVAFARRHAVAVLALRIRDDPRTLRASAGGRTMVLVPAHVERITVGTREWTVGGEVVVVAADPAWRALLPSQRVRALGALAPSAGPDLTVAVLHVRGPPEQIRRPALLQQAAGVLRSGLRRACGVLSPREAGLVPGLVVGDTSRLDVSLSDDFRTSGMTHLVAVSGSNCAIVCGVVLALATWLGAGRRTRAMLAVVALVGFVVLARPSPSVLRAAVMGLLALAALATGRARAAVPGLCASVFLLVLLDPELARAPGFALSVLATGGLLVLAPRWRDALRDRGWPSGLAEAIAVPAAAQVACTPLLAGLTGQVSLVAVPANLVAIPAVAPATVFGVLAAVVSPVWPGGAQLAARAAGVPAWWLATVAERAATIAGGTFAWPAGLLGGLLLAATLATLAVGCRARPLRRALLAAACASVAVTVAVRGVSSGWPPADWVLVACDVGQGDALALRAGPAAAVVVDAGPEPAAVDQCLRRLHVVAVPLVVVTHFHQDHVGGLAGVLRGRTVGALMVDPFLEPTPAWRHLLVAAGARHLPVRVAVTGQTIRVGVLQIAVLAPRRILHATRSDPNNNSVVLRVRVAGRVLVLAGDSENDAQHVLVSAHLPLAADVLKVAHHGSAYQDPQFLRAVHPRVALVSVGVGNPYGHPSARLLSWLRAQGTRVLRTDREGDLAVSVVHDRLAVAHRGGTHPYRLPRARRPQVPP